MVITPQLDKESYWVIFEVSCSLYTSTNCFDKKFLSDQLSADSADSFLHRLCQTLCLGDSLEALGEFTEGPFLFPLCLNKPASIK